VRQGLTEFTHGVTGFLPAGDPAGYDSKAALAGNEPLRRLGARELVAPYSEGDSIAIRYIAGL
jgi:hypothetical protein